MKLRLACRCYDCQVSSLAITLLSFTLFTVQAPDSAMASAGLWHDNLSQVRQGRSDARATR